MAKIVCWESSFQVTAYNRALPTYGLGQMTCSTSAPRTSASRCYSDGGCTHAPRCYELLAALRYAESRYGSLTGGWQHIRDTGWW